MSAICPYPRKDSPYTWIKYYDPVSGIRRQENTKLRPTDPDYKRKLARKIHAIEGRLINAEAAAGGEAWHLWVPQWLKSRYQGRPASYIKYIGQWRFLSRYLSQKELASPRMFRREDTFDYIEWRRSKRKEKSKRFPALNTALADIKTLGMILREAKRRGFCDEDVTKRHGIPREEPEEKPECTDEEIEAVRRGLEKKPQWMTVAWEIALGTGLRHRDSRIHRDWLNYTNHDIKIPNPKGGKKRAFTHTASNEMIQYLKQVFSDGRQWAWDIPKKQEGFTGLEWSKFFREIGLAHLDFHCTRVTYISRGERNGIPEGVMCMQVNHADVLIHRIYRRAPNAERRRFANAVKMPAPPKFASTSSSRPRK